MNREVIIAILATLLTIQLYSTLNISLGPIGPRVEMSRTAPPSQEGG